MLLLALRLWFWAAVVRPLKHIVPLPMLIRLLHRSPSGVANPRRVQQALESYLRRTGRLPRRAPANCLERSLGAYRLLCRAGAAPSIVVGVRRGAGTSMDGHVWLVVDGRPLGEDETFLAGFRRVLAFDASGQQVPGSADTVPAVPELRSCAPASSAAAGQKRIASSRHLAIRDRSGESART